MDTPRFSVKAYNMPGDDITRYWIWDNKVGAFLGETGQLLQSGAILEIKNIVNGNSPLNEDDYWLRPDGTRVTFGRDEFVEILEV